MNVLVVGSGGREDTIVWKLSQSKKIKNLYCAPGNAGTAGRAKNINIKVDDIKGMIDYCCGNDMDLVVVGPEAPLVAGLADGLRQCGIKVFGPNKDGAQLEGSKVYCKEFLEKYNIPTAKYAKFSDKNKAITYVQEQGAPIVVKADGLAAGKGVIVAMSEQDAIDGIESIMGEKVFGSAGASVVIEEFMEGEEASILAFCDGKTVMAMTSSQDHKRVGDGDTGPNTGGMGAYSPAPVVTPEMDKIIYERVLEPTLKGLQSEGIDYRGILYAGIMVTKNGPKVVEYNVRFGDPETQVVLPRMKNDLVDVFMAAAEQKLDTITLEWHDKHAISVVMAAGGYPASYNKGMEITGIADAEAEEDMMVFHAGTTKKDGKVVTSGGRVLNVTAMGSDIKDAVDRVYRNIGKIKFDSSFYRKDIAHRAINR